ncbi:hypothetical protein Tco_0762931 [Tanacetum coccineum]
MLSSVVLLRTPTLGILAATFLRPLRCSSASHTSGTLFRPTPNAIRPLRKTRPILSYGSPTLNLTKPDGSPTM